VCIKIVALSVNRYPKSSSQLHKGWWPPFHWCDNNAVFIVVSRVYANSLPQKMATNKTKAYTHTALLILSEKMPYQQKYEHFKLSPKFWQFQHICG